MYTFFHILQNDAIKTIMDVHDILRFFFSKQGKKLTNDLKLFFLVLLKFSLFYTKTARSTDWMPNFVYIIWLKSLDVCRMSVLDTMWSGENFKKIACMQQTSSPVTITRVSFELQRQIRQNFLPSFPISSWSSQSQLEARNVGKSKYHIVWSWISFQLCVYVYFCLAQNFMQIEKRFSFLFFSYSVLPHCCFTAVCCWVGITE